MQGGMKASTRRMLLLCKAKPMQAGGEGTHRDDGCHALQPHFGYAIRQVLPKRSSLQQLAAA